MLRWMDRRRIDRDDRPSFVGDRGSAPSISVPATRDLLRLPSDRSGQVIAGPAITADVIDSVQRSAGNQAALRLIAVQRDGEEDEPAPKGVDRSRLKITTSNIDDAIKIMWKTYQILVRMRRDAVDALRVKAEEDAPDPPGVATELILGILVAGVTGPTGMIGTAIAARLIKVGADAALKAKVANEALSNAINSGVQDGAKKAYGAMTGGGDKTDKNARELFFLSQRTALSDEADKVEIYFLNQADDYRKMEAAERGSGLSALKSLQEAVVDTLDLAATLQERASLEGWLVYMAQKKLKKSEKEPWFGQSKGTDIGKVIGKGTWGKPTETEGVLVMQIEYASRDDPRVPMKIVKAELRGLNKKLRKDLERRPIHELAIPMIAWCPAPGGTYHEFSVGRHEGGVPFFTTEGNRYPRNTLETLKFRAWPHLMGIKEEWGQSEEELKKNSEQAAEIIFNREIGPRTLREAGVKLGTSIY